MIVLYYDCFSGISGDMNLGAMIDLGVDEKYLLDELNKLNLHGYHIEIIGDERKGITGTKVNVVLEDHHHHDHDDHHHHEHRNLMDIEKIIYSSKLSSEVKKLSMEMFNKIAKAESKIHGKELEEVHFHEVGAVDSIVDIVGAAICYDFLKVDKVISSPIEVGKGFANCAHGTFPVPAPATLEILKGIPIKKGNIPFEATTPTGAAILATFASEFREDLNINIHKTAYGIGHKDEGDIPNVLRVFLGEAESYEELYMLECNMDDMNPEVYPYVMEGLFKVGAIEVFLTPIIMKKGRPGVNLSVLYSTSKEEEIKDLILKETTTLGFRKYKVQREYLSRNIEYVDTKYGQVRFKNSYLKGEKIKSKLEYEDVKGIAEREGLPFREIYNNISEAQNAK